MPSLAAIAAGLVLGLAAPTGALIKSGGNYGVKTRVGPDAKTGGWFINLGITGAQGKLLPAAPTVMEVAYVFENTPAFGKLQVGDKIVGANGKPFKTPHKFGYGMDKFGPDGPIKDFAEALEASQGEAGQGQLALDAVLPRLGLALT